MICGNFNGYKFMTYAFTTDEDTDAPIVMTAFRRKFSVHIDRK